MKMNKIKMSAVAFALAFTANTANAWDVVFDRDSRCKYGQAIGSNATAIRDHEETI